MIVVADTSVILNLCFLGLESLLPSLFGEVHAPPQVEAEFKRLAAVDPRFQGLAFPPFIRRTAPATITHPWANPARLHYGESAALSLALELRAGLILMDEAEGRACAVSLKLTPMGLLGILVDGKRRVLVPDLEPLLDRLRHEASFWISISLRAAILRAAGEDR